MHLVIIAVAFAWVAGTALALFLARLGAMKAPAPPEPAPKAPDGQD